MRYTAGQGSTTRKVERSLLSLWESDAAETAVSPRSAGMCDTCNVVLRERLLGVVRRRRLDLPCPHRTAGTHVFRGNEEAMASFVPRGGRGAAFPLSALLRSNLAVRLAAGVLCQRATVRSLARKILQSRVGCSNERECERGRPGEDYGFRHRAVADEGDFLVEHGSSPSCAAPRARMLVDRTSASIPCVSSACGARDRTLASGALSSAPWLKDQ